MWPYTDWMEQLYGTLKPNDSYYQHWLRFRRGLIMRSFGAVCLAIPVFAISLSIALSFLPPEYAWYIAGGLGMSTGVLAYNCYSLRCPRCRRWFYDLLGERMANVMERCHHCGLQLYAPHGEL
ncbi:MAG: hypothetical protein QM703_18605 [Gemmatales bacterium]